MKRAIKFHFFEEVTSTQDVARKLVKESNKLHVIFASAQTQGKGTHGKSWISPAYSGLYITFAFELGDTSFCSTLSQLAAVSVCRLIKPINPKIKWPNDILVNNKKISGVMTEVSSCHVYVGIGLNLKNSDAFENIDQPYAALETFQKTEDPLVFAKKLSSIFLELLELWEKHGFESIKSLFCEFFGLLHEHVIIDTPGGLLKGELVDFSSEGYPILKIGTELMTLKHLGHINKA